MRNGCAFVCGGSDEFLATQAREGCCSPLWVATGLQQSCSRRSLPHEKVENVRNRPYQADRNNDGEKPGFFREVVSHLVLVFAEQIE